MQPLILTSRPVSRSEENCACASAAVQPLPSLPPGRATGIWQPAPSLHRAPLPDDHQLLFPYLGAANVVVLNQAAQRIFAAFTQPRRLDDLPFFPDLPAAAVEATARRLAELELLTPMGELEQPKSQIDALTAWLHVTNACNLRCTYCYIDKTEQAMDEATGRAAVEAVFRSALQHGFRAVKLKYAGGEATLNFGLVQKLHELARGLSHQSGLALAEVVLSNGVALTRGMIDFMRAAGMRLMISLDGLGGVHDVQRVFVNGRGSFKQVEAAVERAIELDLPPDLSITVTGQNAGALADVVAFAVDRGLRFNLNFVRDNDCSAPMLDHAADEARLLSGLRAAFAIIEEKLPPYRLIDGLLDRSSFTAPHDCACGAGHSYLVIDHLGGVSRCQMEIERPLTDVTSDNPLDVIRLQDASFRAAPVTEKQGCRECEWRYWCAGGCPLLTQRVTGRSDVKSPYCNVYKAIFPDLLRLEGLRLLKWGSD